MMRELGQRIRRLVRDQRGVAAVEFGMVAPVFFALLIGIIDIGRYMWTLNTVQYAIDQAVRSAVVQKLTAEDEIADLVRSSLLGLNPADVAIDVVPDASSLTITADTTYSFLFPISSFMGSAIISLRTEMPK